MQEIIIVVLAHNEERRIAACLASLPLGNPAVAIHVVVNGSTDRTAAIARATGGAAVTVHDWPEGGKSRSWNRFILDTPGLAAETFVFVDGDAAILPGSVRALAQALQAWPGANAAAGLPANGRRAAAYRREMAASHGIFGDLYALRGSFVARFRASGIRLPDDLVGDDGLVGALAKTNLGPEHDWQDERIAACAEAGFVCEPIRLLAFAGWRNQYRRMINYSVRHFQNRMISAIMCTVGPGGMPTRLVELYSEWLPQFRARRDPQWWWFDRKALARMQAAALQRR